MSSSKHSCLFFGITWVSTTITTMKELIRTIHERQNGREKPLVVTIGGPTAGGKTTLARQLAAQFPATIIHADDYYYGDEFRRHHLPAELAGNFDHPASFAINELAKTIAALRVGHATMGPAYDRQTGQSHANSIYYPPQPLIIVEGLIANLPELAPLRDLSVCITALSSVRLARRIARDQLEKTHHNDPAGVTTYFWYCAEPMYQQFYSAGDAAADVVLST